MEGADFAALTPLLGVLLSRCRLVIVDGVISCDFTIDSGITCKHGEVILGPTDHPSVTCGRLKAHL